MIASLPPNVAEVRMFDLTNADRLKAGVPVLVSDQAALSIARQRAADQLGSQPLNHYQLDGQLAFVVQLKGADVLFAVAGENLVRAATGVSASRLELALMNSPLHRANIVDPEFKRVAIGSATNGSQWSYAEVYRD